MFDFHEKRKIRGILYSKTVSGILLLFAFLMSISVYDRFSVAHEIKEKLEVRTDELEMLQTRAESLEAKVRYLEDDRGIEEELRNRFDVAKEGEQVVVLVQEEEKQNVTPTTTASSISTDEKDSKTSFLELLKFW